jgi:hypothetical protein
MRRVVDVALVGLWFVAALACSSKSGDDDGSRDAGNAAAGSPADASGGATSGGEGGADTGGKSGASTGGGSAQGGRTGAGGNTSEPAAGAGAVSEGGSDAQGGESSTGGSGTSGTGGVTTGGTGGAGAQGGGGNGGRPSGGSSATGGSHVGGSGGATTTMYTLTVEFIGDVSGKIRNSLSTFTCEQSEQPCTRTLPKDYEDTYHAQPENGAGTYFAGFGGDCEGLTDCELRMDEDKHFTVEFREQTHNFVFLSSRGQYTSQGFAGAAKFDEHCNELATAAGINNETNDAYIAWVSDDNSLALDRLGATARGWVRLDGKPVVDTVEDLLAGKFFYSIRVDDAGAVHDDEIVGTGTLADGSAAPDNCDNWTSESSGYDFAYGDDAGGPTYWTESGTRHCYTSMKFYCFGTDFSEPVTLTPEEGKLIYLSEPYVPNPDTTPDEACAASAPPGTGEVRAMLAYNDKAGADVLSNGTQYVRPDGQLLGFGAEIVEASSPGVQATVDDYLPTGIWQTGDATYLNEADSAVWVGDINMTRAIAGDCDDFTSSTGSGTVGDYRDSGHGFWDQEYGDRYRNCDTPHRLYCVEQ